MSPTPGTEALEITISSREGLAESVYRELRSAICEGRIPAGERLVQNGVADQLGISRTPVRDALLRLSQEGLVEPSPVRGGYLVSDFTEREVFDIYDIRLALEPAAAESATGRHSGAQLALLREINEQLREAPDFGTAESFELNRQFHDLVVAPCDNRIRRRLLDQLWSMPISLRMYQLHMISEDEWTKSIAEHDSIIQALEEGDPEAVRATVAEHIRISRADALAHVEATEEG